MLAKGTAASLHSAPIALWILRGEYFLSYDMIRPRDLGVRAGEFCVCKVILTTYIRQVGAIYTQTITKPATRPPASPRLTAWYLNMTDQLTAKSEQAWFLHVHVRHPLGCTPSSGEHFPEQDAERPGISGEGGAEVVCPAGYLVSRIGQIELQG